MAYFTKLKSGLWRVQIDRRGVRMSQTFTTKAAGTMWAAREEAAILDGTASRWPRKTLGDALDRYEREITPGKGAKKFESVAFGLIRREYPALCVKVLHQITPTDLAEWRDDRLKHVKGATVQRYANILRAVWTMAGAEWGWCPALSPWKSIKIPSSSPPRERLIGWREARLILRRLNYSTGMPPITKMQECAYAFLLGLRTAMRAGELLSITGESANLGKAVVTLEQHKTRHQTNRARQVPVTRQAVRLLSVLHKPGPLFTVQAGSLDALFRKARDQAMVAGVHFHDSRATALTHLSRRVDLLTLARISGHRDVSLLASTYFRESSAAIAARL